MEKDYLVTITLEKVEGKSITESYKTNSTMIGEHNQDFNFIISNMIDTLEKIQNLP